MQRKDITVQDPAGNAISGALLTVTTNTDSPVTVYSDNAGTVQNPTGWVANYKGQAFFYAPDGRYNIYAVYAGVTYSELDVILDDPADDVTNLSTVFTTKTDLAAPTGATLVSTTVLIQVQMRQPYL